MTPLYDKLGNLMGHITLSAEREQFLLSNRALGLPFATGESPGFQSFMAAAGVPTSRMGTLTIIMLGDQKPTLAEGTIDDLDKVEGLCFCPSWGYIKSLLRV